MRTFRDRRYGPNGLCFAKFFNPQDGAEAVIAQVFDSNARDLPE
jgi:hypothetical protein